MAEGTQESSWRLKLGVSLHCLSQPCAAQDVALLAGSAVETLEISANMFGEPEGVALRLQFGDDVVFEEERLRQLGHRAQPASHRVLAICAPPPRRSAHRSRA